MTNEQLAAAAQSGDRRALFDLWESVRPFCMAAAWHMYRQSDPAKLFGRGVTLEDMQQETYFAFAEAVRGFKLESGYKFLSFLTFPLKNAFAQLLGFRTYGKGSPDPLDKSLRIDCSVCMESDTPLSDMLEDQEAGRQLEDVEDSVYTAQLHAALEAAMLEACDGQQRDVLQEIYYRGRNRQECGEALSLTVSEVRRIERRALQNLRNPEAARHLQSFRDEYAYSVSTSFGAWKEKGSNPERVAEMLDNLPPACR